MHIIGINNSAKTVGFLGSECLMYSVKGEGELSGHPCPLLHWPEALKQATCLGLSCDFQLWKAKWHRKLLKPVVAPSPKLSCSVPWWPVSGGCKRRLFGMVFKQQMGQLLEREVGEKRLPLSSRKRKILAKDFPSPVPVSSFPCKREKEVFGCVGLSTVYFAMQSLCFAAVAQRSGIDTSSSHYIFLNHCHVALRAGQILDVGMAIFTFFSPSNTGHLWMVQLL